MFSVTKKNLSPSAPQSNQCLFLKCPLFIVEAKWPVPAVTVLPKLMPLWCALDHIVLRPFAWRIRPNRERFRPFTSLLSAAHKLLQDVMAILKHGSSFPVAFTPRTKKKSPISVDDDSDEKHDLISPPVD